MAFANNRILANIDLYQKNTTGLLLKKPIPYYDGGGTTWVNLGEVKNRGIEFSLTGIPIQNKNLIWESTFNVSYSKTAPTMPIKTDTLFSFLQVFFV